MEVRAKIATGKSGFRGPVGASAQYFWYCVRGGEEEQGGVKGVLLFLGVRLQLLQQQQHVRGESNRKPIVENAKAVKSQLDT